MSLLERSEAEEELEDWLSKKNIDRAYELTETLLEYGFDLSNLEEVCNIAGKDNFQTVLTWIENSLRQKNSR